MWGGMPDPQRPAIYELRALHNMRYKAAYLPRPARDAPSKGVSSGLRHQGSRVGGLRREGLGRGRRLAPPPTDL